MSWKPSTTEVLPEAFDEVVAAHNVAVFHFWASWNTYDRTMDQVLCEIADAYKGEIFFGSIDTDNQGHRERCKAVRIVNLPALVSFVNGQHFETLTGLRSKESVNSKVQEWLNAAQRL